MPFLVSAHSYWLWTHVFPYVACWWHCSLALSDIYPNTRYSRFNSWNTFYWLFISLEFDLVFREHCNHKDSSYINQMQQTTVDSHSQSIKYMYLLPPETFEAHAILQSPFSLNPLAEGKHERTHQVVSQRLSAYTNMAAEHSTLPSRFLTTSYRKCIYIA